VIPSHNPKPHSHTPKIVVTNQHTNKHKKESVTQTNKQTHQHHTPKQKQVVVVVVVVVVVGRHKVWLWFQRKPRVTRATAPKSTQ
jgi:cell envelope opacity-associated protein A